VIKFVLSFESTLVIGYTLSRNGLHPSQN